MAKKQTPRIGLQTERGAKQNTRHAQYTHDCILGQEPLRDNSAPSQRGRILHHLQNTGSLTTIEARHKLDIMHPAMRVLELKRAGHQIDMAFVTAITPEGNAHLVGRYTLQKSHQLSLFDFAGPREASR